jgi:hypothetical protein
MTPEQLDMYKRLQPLYKRVMGEWQIGDKIYFNCCQAVITQLKDEYIYAEFENDNKFLSRDTIEFANNNFLRIPLTIDSEHPERGLWGMLNDKGKWFLLEHYRNSLPYFLENDPTTAILKALCEQEGV